MRLISASVTLSSNKFDVSLDLENKESKINYLIMKKILLAAGLLCAVHLVKAQDIQLIPKAGLNFSRQSISNMEGEKIQTARDLGKGQFVI